MLPDTIFEIGPARPAGNGNWRRRVYVGADATLKGRVALVAPMTGAKLSEVCAQFNDLDIKYAYGWWPFDEKDFADA